MKRMYLWLAALTMPLCVSAANEQNITVGGITVDMVVKEIAFDGDNVVLTYTDNTSDREDMALVTLAFTYDGQSTGISQVEITKEKKIQQIYTLHGLKVGTSLQGLHPGIYIVNGKKVLIK